MATRTLLQDVHDSDEELRFFSEPPPTENEHELLNEPSSLAPTTHSATSEHRLDPVQRADLIRLDARRRQWQRRVGAVLAGAVVLVLLAVGQRRQHPLTAAKPRAIAAMAPLELVTPAPSSKPSLLEVPPPAPSSSASLDGAASLGKARDLLRAGRTREGIAAARQVLSQMPEEAEPYLLLGAGLQDLGDFNQARRIFADCVKLAKRGPSSSCRYFSRL